MSEITYNNDVIYNGGDSSVTLKTRYKVMRGNVVIETPPTPSYTEFTITKENPNFGISWTNMLPNVAVFEEIDGKNVAIRPASDHGFIIPVLNDDIGEHYKFMNFMVYDSSHEVDIIVFVDGVDYVAPYSDNNHYIIVNSDTYYHTIEIYVREHQA